MGKDMLNSYWKYCREERQFAVFLYNVFWENRNKEITTLDSDHKKVIRECLYLDENSEFTIEDVYFEATLMRDYFAICLDKTDFNKKLLAFCFGWWNFSTNSMKSTIEQLVDEIIDELNEVDTSHTFCTRNLGQKEAKKAISDIYTKYLKILKEKKEVNNEIIEGMQKKASLEIARMMMNATPDIHVKENCEETPADVFNLIRSPEVFRQGRRNPLKRLFTSAWSCNRLELTTLLFELTDIKSDPSLPSPMKACFTSR